MHSGQYNKQTYGYTNRPPPAAYSDGAPQMPSSYQNTHQPEVPYNNTTAASNYMAYGVTSQMPTSYQASVPTNAPTQYNANPYSALNYSATQGGYQTNYQAAQASTIPPTQQNMPNSSQQHPGY